MNAPQAQGAAAAVPPPILKKGQVVFEYAKIVSAPAARGILPNMYNYAITIRNIGICQCLWGGRGTCVVEVYAADGAPCAFIGSVVSISGIGAHFHDKHWLTSPSRPCDLYHVPFSSFVIEAFANLTARERFNAGNPANHPDPGMGWPSIRQPLEVIRICFEVRDSTTVFACCCSGAAGR